MSPEDRWQDSLTRRAVLSASAGVATVSLGGCLEPPSSGGPPYETYEIDDGPVYEPGLQDERPTEFYAGLVTSEDDAAAFDRSRLSGDGKQFIEGTAFPQEYLGVVQVSGVNSSLDAWVPDVSESRTNLTVVVDLADESPASDDRVITTLLVRVTRTRRTIPEKISVELSMGDRHETFAGE